MFFVFVCLVLSSGKFNRHERRGKKERRSFPVWRQGGGPKAKRGNPKESLNIELPILLHSTKRGRNEVCRYQKGKTSF